MDTVLCTEKSKKQTCVTFYTQTFPVMWDIPVSFTPGADWIKPTLAVAKVSNFRTSEVCRGNLPWLSPLHDSRTGVVGFYIKIKVQPLLNHPFNITFVYGMSEAWPAHWRSISKVSTGLWLWHLLPYQNRGASLPTANLRKHSPLQLYMLEVMVMTWKSLGSKGILINELTFISQIWRQLQKPELQGEELSFMQPDLSARESSLICMALQRLLLTFPPTHRHLLGHGSSRGFEFSSYSWMFLVRSFEWLIWSKIQLCLQPFCEKTSSILYLAFHCWFSFFFFFFFLDPGKFIIKIFKHGNSIIQLSTYPFENVHLLESGQLWTGVLDNSEGIS